MQINYYLKLILVRNMHFKSWDYQHSFTFWVYIYHSQYVLQQHVFVLFANSDQLVLGLSLLQWVAPQIWYAGLGPLWNNELSKFHGKIIQLVW